MKNVDFRNGRPLVMMVSQYDFGYSLQVALWSNGTPVTITAAEIVSENFTVACTFSGNVVTIPVTTSMTEQFGHFPAELRVTDSTGQVSSKNFDFFVERSPLAVKSTQTYEGDIVEFTAKRVPLSSVVVTMEPIQSGSGDPSPTNVRPITGRTGASVFVGSKNRAVLPASSSSHNGITFTPNVDGTITASGTVTSAGWIYTSRTNVPFSELGFSVGGEVTLSVNDGLRIICEFRDASRTLLQLSPTVPTGIVPSGTTLVNFYYYAASTSSTPVGAEINVIIKPQLERGSTATEWTPSKTTTYPITFTSAGTVYAGAVDLASGVLTVTHAGMTIDETMNINIESTRFYVGQNNCKRQTNYSPETLRCDRLPTVAYEGEINFGSPGVTAYKLRSNFPGRNWIYFSSGDASITTVAQMKEWLADNPLQVVYELVEPITYNLTPVQVMSLLGENVVWSPDGEIEVVVPEFY